MNKRIVRADILLLLTAAIWGFGFVAQRSGMQYVGPFTYNGIRFLLAALFLLPLLVWNARKHKLSAPLNRESFFHCLLLGSCLFIAVSIQQMGMMFTTAGNAGFITGLYVIFTPIFGLFLGRKTGKSTWAGAFLMMTALYFLSSSGPLGGINTGDLLIAVSAMFWALHVLLIDKLVQKTDPLVISVGQFAFSGLYALGAAFLLEGYLSSYLSQRQVFSSGLFYWKSLPVLIDGLGAGTIPLSLVSNALVPILYGGLISVGIGYTLQVVAQRDAPPAHAAIILCLEGCFAALGGILLLHESIGSRTIIGFILALTGMLACQWGLIRGQTKIKP